jgi:hypothetical protein
MSVVAIAIRFTLQLSFLCINRISGWYYVGLSQKARQRECTAVPNIDIQLRGCSATIWT